MPFLRSWTSAWHATTSATSISCQLPAYQPGDLLLAILSADTGAQTWSSAGWTQLFSVTNTVNLGVLWKIAGENEVAPTFGYTVAETANCHLLAIGDVNQTQPFNGTGGAGTGYRTANNTAARAAMPVLTTTVDNCLILYIIADSGVVVPGVWEGACVFEDAMDGSAHSDGFSWGFKTIAGATPSNVFANKLGTAAGILATIGVAPPASGATVVPAFPQSDNSIYVDPINGTTAYNGNTAFAATITTNFGTTVGSQPLANGTVAATADVGLHSYHSMAQVTGVTTNGTYAGGCLVLAAANRPNVTGRNIICHTRPNTPVVYQRLDDINKATSKGLIFGMASGAGNYKFWHVHGANTLWNTSAHVPIVINEAAPALASVGTLNTSAIQAFGFAVSGTGTAPAMQFGSLWVLDTTVICGGSMAAPVTVSGFAKAIGNGKERMSALQQGDNQVLLLQPVQFGSGGVERLVLDLNASAIEFPRQRDPASRQVYYNSVDNVVGITYYAGPNDVVRHRNSVVSSPSKFHWRIHPSSSASATYDFSGLSIIGAGDVVLQPVTTFANVSFTNCPSITQNGAALDGCRFVGSTLTADNIGSISDCEFQSGGSGHAIIITQPGTYTFSGNTFEGYGADGTTDAAIYNNSGGAVTINVSGGGSTPTVRNGPGATTTVNNSVTLTITGIVPGSDIVILQSGTSTARLEVDSHPSSSYAYAYQDPGASVDIGLFKIGYLPYYVRNYTLGSTDTTLPVSQVQDRNYSNP